MSVNEIIAEINNESELFIETISLDEIESNSSKLNEWEQIVVVENERILFKLDTGAQCKVIPLKYVKQLKKVKKTITSHKIVGHGGNKIVVLEYIILKCFVKLTEFNLKILVANHESKPILGFNTVS